MNEPIQEGKPIYVFQLPIRIWHWSMVLSFLVLIPTGYIIGKPWHSLDGDPTYLFYMGYTRMAHFIAGFIITIGLLWRIIFAFFGNKYSRQVFIIPFYAPGSQDDGALLIPHLGQKIVLQGGVQAQGLLLGVEGEHLPLVEHQHFVAHFLNL